MGNLKVIKKKIKELNLENYIEIFSYLKNEEIVKLYKNCLGVLFPSFVGAESYPLFRSFFFKNQYYIIRKSWMKFIIIVF